jgi:hypothetical protein
VTYKRITVAVVVVLLIAACSAQELTKRFTNKDVIDMVSMGLGDDVVIDKIRTSGDEAKFDTSLEGLKALKDAKVSDAIIRVMINPHVAAAAAVVPVAVSAPAPPAAPAEDPNMPPKEVGVYWKNGTRFVFIEGQNVSQGKIGGRAAHYFSYGIASKHWNAVVTGAEAKNKVKDNRPALYLYVTENSGPQDYVLVKLDKKDDRREFEVGKIGGWGGGKAGTKEGKHQGFEYERIAARTYKLTLVDELKPGEYGLFFQSGQAIAGTGKDQMSGAAQGRIFDFSISQ